MPKISWMELSNLKHDAYEFRNIVARERRRTKIKDPNEHERLEHIDNRVEAFIAKLDVLTLNHEKEVT